MDEWNLSTLFATDYAGIYSYAVREGYWLFASSTVLRSKTPVPVGEIYRVLHEDYNAVYDTCVKAEVIAQSLLRQN